MSAIRQTAAALQTAPAGAKAAKPAKTMSIGVVLERLRAEFPDVTVSKIRFLESEGLITPQRTASGYRRFTEEDVERLRYILVTQRDNYLPLKVIREQLEAMDSGHVTALLSAASSDAEPMISPENFRAPVATHLTATDVAEQAQAHPDAPLYIHPECGCANSAIYLAGEGLVEPERVHMLSTGGMLDRAHGEQSGTVLVATETGMLQQLQQAAPQTDFKPVNPRAECRYMKMITPEKLVESLRQMRDEVTVDPEMADKARASLERMIELGNPGSGE